MRFITPTTRILAVGLLAIALPAAAQTGPAPAATHLPADVLQLACAPRVVFETPNVPLRITGSQDTLVRRVHSPGDLVTINAGANDGVRVGQEFFARRLQVSDRGSVSADSPATVRTVGWIRVYAVDEDMSLATVTYACDVIDLDDYLEPFSLPAVPTPSTNRPKPQRGNYGRVMGGNDRKFSFGKGDYFVVNRGSDHGVTPGAQFVIYRDKKASGNFLAEIAEAVAVEVQPETSTLHVTLSRDAIAVNDYVALRK